MKNGRRCPKCGSEDVVCCRTSVDGAYDKIQSGVFRMVKTDRWVCCACGYCELWVDTKGLDKLREFWRDPPEDL